MLDTIIVDNGGYQVKLGRIDSTLPRLVPNSIIKSKLDRKRTYVADELNEWKDRFALFFVSPFEKGYVVNWDAQLQIWNRLFGREILNVDFRNCNFLLTDPSDIAKAFNDENLYEIVFENYQFNSFLKTSAPSCVARYVAAKSNNSLESISEYFGSCIVVDSGHSFTHIVPFIRGQIAREGVIRIEIGGKALTNQLKEWVSYRQLDVREETFIMNECKEDTCFISTDFSNDLVRLSKQKIEYLLPDFVTSFRGEINDTVIDKDKQIPDASMNSADRHKLWLGVERVALPELLFHPSDIGLEQMGIVEAIYSCIQQFPREIQYSMTRNIVLIGGNAMFQGYKERIQQDLRSLLSEDLLADFRVSLPEQPITEAWHSANRLLSGGTLDHDFLSRFVSRDEYLEQGPKVCRSKFSNFYVPPQEDE